MSGLFQDDTALPEAPPPEGPGLFGEALPPAPASAVAAPAAAAPARGAVATPYRVLARKYRPTTFNDLIGQDAMVRILRNAFALNRVAHAFMLTGVRGVGKTTTARIIARALNCVGPDGTGGPTADPCGVCANCVAILADRHPDVQEMDAASRTGVDDVREIIEATRFRAMQARSKVFVIDEVHMLSRNAFNALLKTLEEPPPHVTFVFATTEIRKVPITVLSRCQRFDLRRVSVAELSAHFGRIAAREGVDVAREALAQIARAADGSVRDGLSLLDQAIAQAEPGVPVSAAQVADMLGISDREAVFDLMEAVVSGRPAAALAITDRAYERGADLGLMLHDLLELTHTLTRLQAVPALRTGTELPELDRTRGTAMAERLSVPALGRIWQMLLKGVQEVETAPDRRAAAEMVLLRLSYLADVPPPGDLVRRIMEGATAPAAPPSSSPPGSSPLGSSPLGSSPLGSSPLGSSPLGSSPVGSSSGGGGAPLRAVSGGGPRAALAAAAAANAVPAPAVAGGAPALTSFRDVVALASARREAMLAAHLTHSVHLVRFAPPVIELRPQADAPRDLASRLSGLLTDATGQRWTVALSGGTGEPTLAEQQRATLDARLASIAQEPLVRAILAAFPGARLEPVEPAQPEPQPLTAAEPPETEPDSLEFAPPDAEPADAMPEDWEI